MLEFRSGGRRISQDQFFENLKNEAIEAGMNELEQRVHAAAASIVDPDPASTPTFSSAAAARPNLFFARTALPLSPANSKSASASIPARLKP